MNKFTLIIGIDTGTHTGVAVWHRLDRKFVRISTLLIHDAMEVVLHYHVLFGDKVFVRFEDARLRKWLQNKTDAQLQGAGSIKRDCTIWDDFLKSKGIAYASIAPRNGLTKLEPDKFKQITGWQERTSNHARDAAMLVYST